MPYRFRGLGQAIAEIANVVTDGPEDCKSEGHPVSMITPPCVPGYTSRGSRSASWLLDRCPDVRQLVRKLGPILLLAVLGLPVSLLLLGGCAGSRFSGDPGIVFPPAQMRPGEDEHSDQAPEARELLLAEDGKRRQIHAHGRG